MELYFTFALFLFFHVIAARLFRSFAKPLKRGTFSLSRYYGYLSTIAVPFLLLFLIQGEYTKFFLFFVFGVTAVLGEIIFSFIWDILYDKKIWRYHVKTLIGGYSSWLNFIPYSIGGTLYLYVADFAGFSLTAAELVTFWTLVLSLLTLLITSRLFINLISGKLKTAPLLKKLEFGKFTIISYGMFAGTLLLPVLYLDVTTNTNALLVFTLFAFIGWAAEYKFGKSCEAIAGKKLWTYQYAAIDHGHLTFLTIIPFGFVGFCFLTVQYLFEAVF